MKLTKSSLSQLMKCKSLKCTFRNKRKAQIQPCGDVYSSIYGYFNLEDDYDENLHNKNDSRFDIISVEEYMSKYFNGDKLGSYEDSPITYVHNNMEEKFNKIIADLEAKLAESEKKILELQEDSIRDNMRYIEELAEKEKEIERLNLEFETQEDWQEKWQKLYDETCNLNQDKISFALEQLEKVKENIKKVPITDYDLSRNFEKMYKQDAIRQIDKQIEQLKKIKKEGIVNG